MGPIITFFFVYNWPEEIYTFAMNRPNDRPIYTFTPAQNLGFAMAILHYVKRVIECTGVHIYSKPTKSLSKLIWEISYTWLFFGIGISYYIFHP